MSLCVHNKSGSEDLWADTVLHQVSLYKEPCDSPEMTDGFQIAGVLLEPLLLTRCPLLSVSLFSAMRTKQTRAGTLQQPECRVCRHGTAVFLGNIRTFQVF